MIREKIILLGSGGHAGIVLDIIEEMDVYNIVGVVTKEEIPAGKFNGYKILGDDNVLTELLKDGITKAVIGVGGFKDNVSRKKIFTKLKEMSFEIVPAIHPKAIISRSVTINEGMVAFAGVVINPNVRIGNNVIIATGATIDHETELNDHVLVSAGVTVGANSYIREGALLALGSKIISGVTVGRNVLIGAGAVVVKDCIEPGTYLGTPAKKRSWK